ncbi:MAG: orotate phosphoribosyltransferase [Gammaproteobacteria bacterium]|nr:orotate phosphoribosyltransferase [Gammaproteobacteria bacterium]
MRDYQREFFDFVIDCGVLRFGSFTLKSGRISPYFFNSGLFNSGRTISALGRYYAAAIEDSGMGYDMLYGPAYKGIPLAVATAIALNDHHRRDVPYAFNRKEAKGHGEGGIIVGSPLNGRVLVIDDVISAGTSARESADIIRHAGAEFAGMAIALNRQERGLGAVSAIQEVEQDYGIRVTSIVDLATLISYLEQKKDKQGELTAIRAYQQQYGTG